MSIAVRASACDASIVRRATSGVVAAVANKGGERDIFLWPLYAGFVPLCWPRSGLECLVQGRGWSNVVCSVAHVRLVYRRLSFAL